MSSSVMSGTRPGRAHRPEGGVDGGERRVVDPPVRLLADAVDAQALRLQPLDEADRRVALGRLPEVVVVVVELGLRVGLARELERLLDVVLADRLEPGRLAQRPVLVERLVHDVPAADPALVAARRPSRCGSAGARAPSPGRASRRPRRRRPRPASAGATAGRGPPRTSRGARPSSTYRSAGSKSYRSGLGVDGLPLEHVLGADLVEVAGDDGEPGRVLAVALLPVEGDADAQARRAPATSSAGASAGGGDARPGAPPRRRAGSRIGSSSSPPASAIVNRRAGGRKTSDGEPRRGRGGSSLDGSPCPA